jgi:cation transport ATPase
VKKTDNNKAKTNRANLNNKETRKNQKGKYLKWFLYAWSFSPLFLSHHPECDKFSKSHTLNIGKLRFCIGCFVGYPAAFIALYLINLLNLDNSILYSLFLPLSICFLATFILSLLKLTKYKKVKIMQKIFIGIGAALLFSWIMGLANPPRTNYNIAFITIFILITVLNIYHAYGFLHTCYKCETPFDWGRCEGFRNIRNKMDKYDLFNILIYLDEFSQKIKEKRKKQRTRN